MPGGGSFRISRWIIGHQDEAVERIQILCANCHAIKSWSYGPCHVTATELRQLTVGTATPVNHPTHTVHTTYTA